MAATTHSVVSATQSPSRKRWGTYAHKDFSGAVLFGQALDVFRRLKKAIGIVSKLGMTDCNRGIAAAETPHVVGLALRAGRNDMALLCH